MGHGLKTTKCQGKEDSQKASDNDFGTLMAMYFLNWLVVSLPSLVEVGDNLIERPSLVSGGLPDA